MLWFLSILIALLVGLAVWFTVPYSPVVGEFFRLKDGLNAGLQPTNQVFAEADIEGLPSPLQRYFENCGFLGKPRMFNMKMVHKDVDFILSDKMPVLKIDCTQFNSTQKPERVALIDTRLYGIPFQGIDAYLEGAGSMEGVIAKGITLFNQTGESMNQSSLVNCLAESLLVPGIALQDFMRWEAVDQNHVKGTISYYGISVSGIFHFDENGYMDTFTTDDRLYVDPNGNVKRVRWSAICGDYRDVGGIQQPKSLQAVWHLPEGDLVYFDGHNTTIEYDVTD